MNTLYWHDYETFGKDPRRDRPCQFAGLRTDEDLNVIGEPLVLYCRPPPDYLPDPVACLVTGITPALASREGKCEAEFCARIHRELAAPGTCTVGYNSIRFDDEVTRHLLYRCFYDPYEREWKNGNSRWDIIDMLRLAHAVRPEGIRWPVHEDGHTSFRLEDLTRENGIAHDSAHDALSDVRATIEMARLVKKRQGRLYNYLFQLRRKNRVLPMLDPARREPLLHVSAMYPAERGHLAVVVPVARHPENANGVIVCDLHDDPARWMDLDVEALRRRLFTPREELPQAVERIPLKTVHANKCPALAPLSVLDDATCTRWGIDLEQCRRHLDTLAAGDAAGRIAAAYASERETVPDPELMLYSGGFIDDSDKAAMAQVRERTGEALAEFHVTFQDPRLEELLLRYRARNYPDSLAPDERERWRAQCRSRLMEPERSLGLSWPVFWESLDALRGAHPDREVLFGELACYARDLGESLGLTEPARAGGGS